MEIEVYLYLISYHQPVLAQVRTGDLVFRQGITQCDTLRGSNSDAQ